MMIEMSFSQNYNFKLIFLLALAIQCWQAHADASETPLSAQTTPSATAAIDSSSNSNSTTDTSLSEFCIKIMGEIPGKHDANLLKKICEAVKQTADCKSVTGQPIFHYEKTGIDSQGKKILAISLIHGDELPSGGVTRSWMGRLDSIEPRNTWRVIPVANPDSFKNRTRYNENKVDVNRNFPSKDWDTQALHYWETKTKKDPRRYPGPHAASEPETRCLVQHIEEFKPDFIISIHTPLGVLDFDGPKIGNPGFKPLPWVGLGNFVGSLGRYMWVDNKVPVLTIELKGNEGLKSLEEFDRLQDIAGTVAIQAGRLMKTTNKK
jgi:protein MpaA